MGRMMRRWGWMLQVLDDGGEEDENPRGDATGD